MDRIYTYGCGTSVASCGSALHVTHINHAALGSVASLKCDDALTAYACEIDAASSTCVYRYQNAVTTFTQVACR